MLRGGGKRDEQRSAEVLEIHPAGGYNHIDIITVSDGVPGASNTLNISMGPKGVSAGKKTRQGKRNTQRSITKKSEEESRMQMRTILQRRRPRFSVEQIETIRQHVLIKEQPRDGGIKRFHCDYDISQAWQRLVEGKNVQASDIVLLQHEYYELTIMAETGCVYEIAHEIAEQKYNWRKALSQEKQEE